MDRMRFTDQDGNHSYSWVVYGDQKGCCLFDKSYQGKGHAVRRAKKLIGEGDYACVVKDPRANFYRVMKGNALSDLIFWAASAGDDQE